MSTIQVIDFAEISVPKVTANKIYTYYGTM